MIMTESFKERIRSVTEFLESIAKSRELLSQVSEEEQRRLVRAAGEVFEPDSVARRRLLKANRRQHKFDRRQNEEATLAETGIRRLRRQSVFTTPNVFPPSDFEQQDVDDPDFREASEPQHCYICKQSYSSVHHFYDQLCPECAAFNFFKRSETADLRGRVALL